MAIREKRRNEGRTLIAGLLNALAIGGIAWAIVTPFGVDGVATGVEITTRIAYFFLAVYLHLCGQTALGRLEDEFQRQRRREPEASRTDSWITDDR